MIVVEGTIRVRDLEAARPFMHAMIEASRREHGCIDYSYAVDLVDTALIRVNERWVDRNALDLHLQTEHIATWRACWRDVGITERSLRLYEADPERF